MKISHWCVIAGIIMLVFCLQWGMKYQLLWKLSYTKLCYNQIADNALEDGLQAGVEVDADAAVCVDEKLAVEAFEESLLQGFGLSKEDLGGQRLLECIVCIVILQENSFTMITDKGSENCSYPCENGEWDTESITDCVEAKMQEVLKEKVKGQRYVIDFPSVREDGCHTLDGVGMLCFMQYGEYDIDGFSCNRYVLSGAGVKKNSR